MRASPSCSSVTGRPAFGNFRKSATTFNEHDSTALFKLILFSKPDLTKGGSRRSSANKRLLAQTKGNRLRVRYLDPIPEYPMMADDEICRADSPKPTSTSNSDPTTKPRSLPRNRRGVGRLEIRWFNELENDIVRHAIAVFKSLLCYRKSLGENITIFTAGASLLFSSLASALHSAVYDSRQYPIGHAILAILKLAIFAFFSFRFCYARARKKCTSASTVFVFASLCTQYASVAPSLFFGGLTYKCWLDEDPWSADSDDANAKTRTRQWPAWLFLSEAILLLVCLASSNLYFWFIIRQLQNLGEAVRKNCKLFLTSCLVCLLILELGSLFALLSWVLNVGCFNQLPIPEYFAGFYFKRRPNDKPSALLIVCGCLIGLIFPAGLAAFVAMHLENFVALCAAVVSTVDKSAIFDSVSAETIIVPDHVAQAAQTYLTWFYEHNLVWQYCSLWNAARTMRSRQRIRYVAARFFTSWIWYACAVVVPIVVTIRCCSRWRVWAETSQYSEAIFVAPLALAFVFNFFANPLAVIIAPITMVLFAFWFITFLAVQVFYFFAFVTCPDYNAL